MATHSTITLARVISPGDEISCTIDNVTHAYTMKTGSNVAGAIIGLAEVINESSKTAHCGPIGTNALQIISTRNWDIIAIPSKHFEVSQ